MQEEISVITVKADEMAQFFLHCVAQPAMPDWLAMSLNVLPVLSGIYVFKFEEYLQYLETFYTQLENTTSYMQVNGLRVQLQVRGLETPEIASKVLYANDEIALKRMFLGDIGLMLALYATSRTAIDSFHIRWTGCDSNRRDSVSDKYEYKYGSPNIVKDEDIPLILDGGLKSLIQCMRPFYDDAKNSAFYTAKGILAVSTYACYAQKFRESYPLWNLERVQPTDATS